MIYHLAIADTLVFLALSAFFLYCWDNQVDASYVWSRWLGMWHRYKGMRVLAKHYRQKKQMKDDIKAMEDCNQWNNN